MNFSFLPSKKIQNRIIWKSWLGLFVASIIFGLFALLYVGSAFLWLGGIEEIGFSNSELFYAPIMIIFMATVYAMFFGFLPTTFVTYLIMAVIYRFFKLGNISRQKAINTGVLLAGLAGLVTSLFVVLTIFNRGNNLIVLLYAIPVTLIASLIGYWGGLQVYKEISIDEGINQ